MTKSEHMAHTNREAAGHMVCTYSQQLWRLSSRLVSALSKALSNSVPLGSIPCMKKVKKAKQID